MRDEGTAVVEQERRFLIRHPENDGGTFELTDYGFFLEEYEPRGFRIVANPPAGYWAGPSEPSAFAPGKRGKRKEEGGAPDGNENSPETPESSGP